MDGRQELRLVTCLFIDVVGSTDATVRLGPERMQRLLGNAFEEISGTIAAHGGVVEKYVGDAILALFGAPTSHADDAERALRAADACVRWDSASTSSAPGLAVRAGVETGELLVDLRAVETRERMVVGESINLAARLQQFAEPGQIVVGPRCHEATTAVADFEPMGELSLKGLDNVEGWRFTGFRDAAEAIQVGFVGREAELAKLRDAFDRARRTTVLALIVGPPGQGKSRLAAEAIRQAAPARVLEARCRPGTETGVNTPLRQLVESDVPDATPDAVYQRLSALVGASESPDIASALCHSSGLAVDERLLAISRYEQRELIARAWQQYLEALTADGPLSVVVEDLHWADPVILRVIDHVTSEVPAGLVVLATARPEFLGTAHLRPRENRLQIELGPLEPSAVERLAELAADGSPAGGASLERAAGNPLFIIELARSRSQPTELPVTIQAAIAARLDELTPSERELLQRASVAGETFEVRDAALLGEREPGEVAAALGRFAHLGFVNQVGSSYRFHHILVRDVAYGRLPVSERMALHARYATDGTDPDDVEAQAHHWWEALSADAEWVWEDEAERAAMRRKAYQVHMAAGARLERRNAYEEATDVYLRAVELGDAATDRAAAVAASGRGFARQGRGDDAWSHRLRAIAIYGEAGVSPPSQLFADMLEIATFNWGYFHNLPDDAEVVRLLGEGADLARSSGDDVSLARLLAEHAAYTGDVSGTDEFNRFLDGPAAVRFADAAQRMATVYAWAGRVAESLSLFATVFEQLVPAGAVINEPEALAWYGMAAFTAGDLARADDLADRLLIDSVRRSPHTRSHAFALKAMVGFGRGDWKGLEDTVRDLGALVDDNPDTPFCLLGGAAFGYGAAAGLVAGRQLPAGIDDRARRMVFAASERVPAASVMLPKAMAGDREAIDEGLRAYEPDLRLSERYRTWDVADLIPGIAFTMLERWHALPPVLERLDEFAAGGARLAEAAAAAIREEETAARGGPAPTHDQLGALGYLGISELLRFRPALTAASTAWDKNSVDN